MKKVILKKKSAATVHSTSKYAEPNRQADVGLRILVCRCLTSGDCDNAAIRTHPSW